MADRALVALAAVNTSMDLMLDTDEVVVALTVPPAALKPAFAAFAPPNTIPLALLLLNVTVPRLATWPVPATVVLEAGATTVPRVADPAKPPLVVPTGANKPVLSLKVCFISTALPSALTKVIPAVTLAALTEPPSAAPVEVRYALYPVLAVVKAFVAVATSAAAAGTV